VGKWAESPQTPENRHFFVAKSCFQKWANGQKKWAKTDFSRLSPTSKIIKFDQSPEKSGQMPGFVFKSGQKITTIFS